MRILLVIFILTVNLSVYSQKEEIDSIKKTKFNLQEKINKIDTLLLKYSYKDTTLYDIFKDYSFWLYKNKKYNKAVSICKKALKIAKRKKSHKKIQKTLFLLGFYFRKFDKRKSILFYNESIKYSTNKNLIKTYYHIANNYFDELNIQTAIKYYLLSEKMAIKENNNSILKSCYFRLSSCYYYYKSERNIFKAKFYAKKADSMSKLVNTRKSDLFYFKWILASLHNEEVSLDIPKSIKYYNSALSIAKNLKDSSKINSIILEMGNLYNTTNVKKSLFYLNKIKPKQSDSTLISALAFNYGLTYNYAKDYKKSIQQYKKAISYKIGTNFNPLKNNDSILFKTEHKRRLLHILPFYALTYYNYFKKTNNKKHLTKSLFYYKLSNKLIDLIKINSREFKSRLFWRKKSEQIYTKAIEVAFLTNNVEDAFYFMEKNKASLLMEDVTKEQFKLTLGIPKDLLAKEIRLKKEIIELKSTNYTKKAIDKERELSIYQDSIYGNNFFDININILPIQQLQNKLSNNDIFVEYFFKPDKKQNNYTDKGYVIFVTNKNNYFYKIDSLNKLKTNLSKLIKTYRNPLKTKEAIKSYNKLSFKIYNKLFPTNKIKKLLKNKKITIATDSYLSYLPFEALITQKDSTHYLIEDCTISYEYSFSFSQNRKPIIDKLQKGLGIAPFIFKDSSLTTLDYSTKESKALSEFYPTVLFEGNKATKDKFIYEMANYNIIHLVTHANAQDSITPWIAFYDRKLYLPELQILQNNASLVVLSGCNTTLGKQKTGEGVISLARGFFYGGSQSVISSLWSIDDVSTAFIMKEFYKNLSEGKTKSESLRNAKLLYLKSHSLSEVSPHFWASFILLGSDDTIISTSNTLYYIISFIFLVLIISVLRYKFKK